MLVGSTDWLWLISWHLRVCLLPLFGLINVVAAATGGWYAQACRLRDWCDGFRHCLSSTFQTWGMQYACKLAKQGTAAQPASTRPVQPTALHAWAAGVRLSCTLASMLVSMLA